MSVYHVLPVNDLVEHDNKGDDCSCGPDVQFGDSWKIVIHHSLDG